MASSVRGVHRAANRHPGPSTASVGTRQEPSAAKNLVAVGSAQPVAAVSASRPDGLSPTVTAVGLSMAGPS